MSKSKTVAIDRELLEDLLDIVNWARDECVINGYDDLNRQATDIAEKLNELLQ